jgi:hypothetical protein
MPLPLELNPGGAAESEEIPELVDRNGRGRDNRGARHATHRRLSKSPGDHRARRRYRGVWRAAAPSRLKPPLHQG